MEYSTGPNFNSNDNIEHNSGKENNIIYYDFLKLFINTHIYKHFCGKVVTYACYIQIFRGVLYAFSSRLFTFIPIN